MSELSERQREIEHDACAREPIHIPGAIQPHGCLISLDSQDFRIRRVSETVCDFTQSSATDLLGRRLADAIGAGPAAEVEEVLMSCSGVRAGPLKLILESCGATRLFDTISHRSGPEWVIELEPSSSQDRIEFQELYHLSQTSVAALQASADLTRLFQAIAVEVRRVSGYDRVMTYRFDNNGDGEVVGEARNDQHASFLGLRYPASDIPAQARRLFALNSLRMIPDVGYQPVALVSKSTDVPPLDMSLCFLRSSSPIHLVYLRNMGVSATLTISIMVKGRLRGLIACHHGSKRYLSVERRLACEFLGQVAAAQWSALEDSSASLYRLRAISLQERIARTMSGLAEGRGLQPGPGLLDLIDAQGAAVVVGGRTMRFGRSPSEEDIGAIIRWLSGRKNVPAFESDELGKLLPKLADPAICSGMLATEISRERGEYLFWFRPELPRVVSWGGDPNQSKSQTASGEGGCQIQPRRSFEVWKEKVQGRSAPWTPLEVEAAIGLRDLTARLGEDRSVRDRAKQQAALATLGQAALAQPDLDELYRLAIELVVSTLGVSCGAVYESSLDSLRLPMKAGSGWSRVEEVDDVYVIPPVQLTEQLDGWPSSETYLLVAGPPESGGPWLEAEGIRSSIYAPVRGLGSVSGILGIHSRVPREFNVDEAGFVASISAVLGNAFDRKRAEEELEHQALHDSLTGLPNRTLFLRRVEHCLPKNRDAEVPLAILLIDLDGFKEINDTYGHDHGDWLLQRIRPRLISAVRGSDTVARLGGDEFAVLIPIADPQSA